MRLCDKLENYVFISVSLLKHDVLLACKHDITCSCIWARSSSALPTSNGAWQIVSVPGTCSSGISMSVEENRDILTRTRALWSR